jgi:hypothetical protein
MDPRPSISSVLLPERDIARSGLSPPLYFVYQKSKKDRRVAHFFFRGAVWIYAFKSAASLKLLI